MAAWRVLLALLLLLGLSRSFAHAAGQVTNDHFENGNRALAQGQPAEALAAYAQIPPDQTSVALEFNRGLAHAQLGQMGHALARLRRAARLAPRDREVDQALTQLRARVGAPVNDVSGGVKFLGRLSLDEWAVLAGVAWWGWFALLFAGRFSGGVRQTVRGYTFVAGVVAAGLGSLLVWSVWQRQLEPAVIATQANAAVRISPLDEAKVAFTVPDGAELRLQEQRTGWMRVEEPSSGRAGWINAGAAVLVPVR
jgi:tetratricopeptide (TPR) repeat protein